MRWSLSFLLLFAPALAAQTPPDPPPAKPADAHGVPVAAAGKTVAITAEQWARPRSGAAVTRLPELAPFLDAFDREPANRVIVRYAGGDEGALWAEELRSWLVALGVPSARIELESSLPRPDRLLLELRRSRAR